MNLSKIILSLFICSCLNATAQVDSGKQKTSTLINKKKGSDTTQLKTSPQREKLLEKKKDKRNLKKDTIIHQGGIGNENSENIIINTLDTIQYLKNNIQELEKENSELKKEIETLRDLNENLQKKINSSNISKEDNDNKRSPFYFFSFIFKVFLAGLLFMVFVIFILARKRKLKINSLLSIKKKSSLQQSQQSQSQEKIRTLPSKVIQTTPIVSNTIVPQTAIPNLSKEPKSFSNIVFQKHKKNNTGNDWYVVGASAIGKSHTTSNKPCQDNHYCENIGNGWGIAISCDGAGSADNSHMGSEFVAKDAFKILKELIENSSYHIKNILPSDNDWNLIVNETFTSLHQHLENFAKSKKLEINSVACTVIAVIYSPIGLLVAHLGDGRAGYCDGKGEWKSVMTPHKGEEANQTIFISTTAWQTDSNLLMSGVPVPESKVIREKPIAFTLMSDGCETHSFECSKMDISTNKWNDPNIPFPKFFNPLVEHLKELSMSKVSQSDANIKWQKFLEDGTIGIKEESDDKTLILGILI